MITQINITDYPTWFPIIDCDTYPEPFMSNGDFYIIYKNINPDEIMQPDIEATLKMHDINIDMDDGSTLFYQLINLEKIYAYMLKKYLK